MSSNIYGSNMQGRFKRKSNFQGKGQTLSGKIVKGEDSTLRKAEKPDYAGEDRAADDRTDDDFLDDATAGADDESEEDLSKFIVSDSDEGSTTKKRKKKKGSRKTNPRQDNAAQRVVKRVSSKKGTRKLGERLKERKFEADRKEKGKDGVESQAMGETVEGEAGGDGETGDTGEVDDEE